MSEELVHPRVTSIDKGTTTCVAVRVIAAGRVVEVKYLLRIVLVEYLVPNGFTSTNWVTIMRFFPTVGYTCL